jgi:hypothetical protein
MVKNAKILTGFASSLLQVVPSSIANCRFRSTASIDRTQRSLKASSTIWRRQGMMGSANAHYECIEVFSETDFTEDHPARRNRNGHH